MLKSLTAKWPITRFLGVIAGNGAATAISFSTAVVAARVLEQSDFVLYNTLILMGAMVSVAGGGIDSSTTRLVASSKHDQTSIQNLLRLATTLRGLLALIIIPCLVPLIYKIADKSQFGLSWSLFGLFSFVLHATLLACYTIEPQANGNFLKFSMRQAIVYLYLFASIIIVLFGAPPEFLLFAPIISATAIGILLCKSLNYKFKHTVPPGYRELAAYLTAASIIYAILDRLDTYIVVATQATTIAAEYSIAARYAGGMALIGSAFTAYILPRASQATSPHDITMIQRRHLPHWLIVLAVAIFASFISFHAMFWIFDIKSWMAASIATIIIFQYPIMAAYIGVVIGLTNLTSRRTQVVLPILMLVTKLLFLPLVFISPILLAIGTPLAHLAGAAYIYWKLIELKKSPIYNKS